MLAFKIQVIISITYSCPLVNYVIMIHLYYAFYVYNAQYSALPDIENLSQLAVPVST